LIAALLGAGEAQMFTEKIEQRNANIQFEIEGLAVYQEMHGGSMDARFRPRTMAREHNDERSIRGPGSILCCSNHAHEWVPARKVYERLGRGHEGAGRRDQVGLQDSTEGAWLVISVINWAAEANQPQIYDTAASYSVRIFAQSGRE
jgi:hypothetical protein